MEDKIERLLFSPNQNNAELALILADNEGIKIEQLPAVKWIINHVFKLKELPEGFEIDTEVISRIMSKRTIEISGKLGLLPNNLYLLSHLIKLSLDFKNHYGYISDSISNLGNLNILQIKNYASNLPLNLKMIISSHLKKALPE